MMVVLRDCSFFFVCFVFIISLFFKCDIHISDLKTLKTGMEKLNKLQNFKEELQRNLSLQLMQNTNSSQKIRNLSIKLEEIATKLCRELYTKNKGNPLFLSELFIRQWTKPWSHLITSPKASSLSQETIIWKKELNVGDWRPIDVSVQLEEKQKNNYNSQIIRRWYLLNKMVCSFYILTFTTTILGTEVNRI